MGNIVETLREKGGFCSLSGATEEEICAAEQALGLTFAEQYRDYLKAFGLASFQGHELTGIIKSQRLNVVAQTNLAKEANSHIPDDFYAIEIANIDGIIIWQKSTGEIFETIYDDAPSQICKSLSDYINLT